MAPIEQRITKYLTERRWQETKFQVWIGIGGIAFILFIIVFGGEPLRPVREFLGISRFLPEERGVYADCSKHSNSNNKFCRRDYASSIKPVKQTNKASWRRPDDGLPFTLYDK